MNAAFKIFLIMHLFIAMLMLFSFQVFMNFEIAFLSAISVILGSMYSYSSLVNSRIDSGETPLSQDVIDTLDDPYDLYSEVEAYDEAMPLKEVIKEEKKRIKSNPVKNFKIGSGALFSWYRIVPYAFLVIGFIALNNNQFLSLFPYLSGLGVGIVSGYFIGMTFIQKS
jgi:hypothetical protein